MAILTVLDPQSGRHFVRAAHGSAPSAVGVEVVPGVGITGQALRDRKLVTVGARARRIEVRQRPREGGSHATDRPGSGRSAPRSNRAASSPRSRSADPTRSAPSMPTTWPLSSLLGPVVTLAIAADMQRQETEQGSPRDSLTGLYNRAYLDAALDQLLALRRRSQPHERPPLSMIMFDIDSFRLFERPARTRRSATRSCAPWRP